MDDVLETTVDKFTFKVATDRFYSDEGIWAQSEGDLVRVGLSDFVQQRSGDVAFAEVQLAGRKIARGAELATVETIKVTISLGSPVTGEVVDVNPSLASAAEVINRDPYGAGWLATIRADDWEADRSHLLDPQAYFERMKQEAEQEVKRQ